MSEPTAGTPPLGTIIELDPDTKVKVISNLTQILTGENSCEGCYFNHWDDEGRCWLQHAHDKNPEFPDFCGDHSVDPEDQILYIKEE